MFLQGRLTPHGARVCLRRLMAAKTICERCGTIGKTQREKRGNFLIELILWVAFCIPGIIYSVWRLSGPQVCRSCGGQVLELSSPRGRQLEAYYHQR